MKSKVAGRLSVIVHAIVLVFALLTVVAIFVDLLVRSISQGSYFHSVVFVGMLLVVPFVAKRFYDAVSQQFHNASGGNASV